MERNKEIAKTLEKQIQNNLHTEANSWNQTIGTQLMQIENYIDEGFLHYENSIGNSNKQQFFGELEQQMISRGFIVEDHLTMHLLTLANLTCAVITDDMVKLRRLQYDNTTKFQKSLNQWSFIWDTLKDSRWNDYNPRQNSQLPQLLKFCTLLFSTQSSTESKAPYANFCQTQGGSTSPICTGLEKNQKNQNAKIDYNQQAINQEIADNLMRKQLFEQLKQAINLNITIIQLEKISMFVLDHYNSSAQPIEKGLQLDKDKSQIESNDGFTALSQPKNVFISYKYYKNRHNDILGSFNYIEEEIKQSISQKNSIFQFFGHSNFCALNENTTKINDYNGSSKIYWNWRTGFECKATQIQDTIYNQSLIENKPPYENYQNLNEIYNEKINKIHKNFGECKKDFGFFQQPLINKVCYQASEICKNFDPVTFTPKAKFTYKGFQESLTSSSALINHPEFNVFEYPIEEIERSESRRIFEKVRNMKSLHFHFNIFQQIKTIVGADKVKTKKAFSQLFYTFDDPKEIERLADGILPRHINKLSFGNPVKNFYEKTIEFDELDFVIEDKLELLRTHIVKFKIINRKAVRFTEQVDKFTLALQNSIVIHQITSSSPDADVILSEAKTFPLVLAPEDSIEVSLMINAENIGKYEALLYFIFAESILVQKIQADVLPNRFGVQPIYMHHYHALSQLNIPIIIANPYKESIYVDEIYTTNSNFQAQIIKQRVNSNSNITVANLVYNVPQTDQAMQQTMFSLKLRKQKSSKKKYDFIRIPIYLMVDSVLIEFKPKIIDFGLVQLHQSPMVIPISIKFNKQNIKRVVDYFLPTNQPNLDFQLVDPFNIQEAIDQAPADCTQIPRNLERMKRRLTTCSEETKNSDLIEFNMGLVYIKPSKTQFISTKIRIKLELHTKSLKQQKGKKDNKKSFPQDNEVFLINKRISWNKNIEPVIPTQKIECGNDTQSFIFIDLPIIGSIVNHSAFISSSLIPEYPNHPLPLVTVKMNQTNIKTEAPLVLKNNLATSNLKIQRIMTYNSYQGLLDNFQFQYRSNKLQLLIKKGKFILEPNGQSMNYGKLIYDDYKSQKQIWMIINNVIVPQKAIFYQNSLQCQWLPSQEDLQSDKNGKFTIFLDQNQQKQILNLGSDHGIGQNEAVKYSYYSCQELPTLDFKQVQWTFQKSQILRITNANPVRINLENLIKKHSDEIKVELIKTRDFQERQIKAQWRGDQLISEFKGVNGIEYELINYKRTQKYIGLFIEPFQSMDLRITVFPKTKVPISSSINFTYTNQFSQNLELFTIYYQYQSVDSQARTKQKELNFVQLIDQRNPMTKLIEIIGAEDQSIHLTKVTLNDQRFSVKFVYQDIMNQITIPKIYVTFDPQFALYEPIIAKMIYKIQNIQNKINLKYTKLFNQSDFNLIANQGRLDFSKNIQPADLRSARYYQSKKETILRNQINQNSSIQMETSVGQILSLPLKGEIQFPRLSQQLELNFGKVQIGNQTMQDINFTNPTDQTIEFQLFLGFDIEEIRLGYLNQINKNSNELFDFLSQKIKDYIILGRLDPIVYDFLLNFSTDGIQNYCSLIFSEKFDMNQDFNQFISDQNKKFSSQYTSTGNQKNNLQDLLLSDEIDGSMSQNYICLTALNFYRNIYAQLNESDPQFEEKINQKNTLEHFFNIAYNFTNNIDYAMNSCIEYQCGIQQVFDNTYKQFLNNFEVQILSQENIELIQIASRSLYEIYEWSIETKKILSSNTGFIDKQNYEKLLQIDNFESNLINLQSTITPLSIRENEQAFLYSQFDKVKEIQKVYDKIKKKDFKVTADNQEQNSETQESIFLAEALAQKQNDSLYQKFINYLQKTLIQTYDFVNYMINYDYYMKRKELLKEVSGQINNLGNFENRYKLKNQEIFQEMIRISTHGLRQQQQYQNLNLNILYPSKLGYEQINRRRKGKKDKYDPDEVAVQNFYLNPIYRQKVFTIPPKSEITVENAIIFQPRSIEFNKTRFQGDLDNLEIQQQKAQKMRVIIKNSLTGIEFIDLNGQGTTAFMEVIDLQKVYEDYSQIDFPHHGRSQFNRRLKKISVVDSGFYNLSKNAPSWFQTNFFEYDSFKAFQYANNRYQFLKTGLTYFSINEKHLMIQGNSDSEELTPVDELGQYYEIYQDFRKKNAEKDAFVLFSLFEQYLRPYNKLLQPQFASLFGKKSEKSSQLFLNQKGTSGQSLQQYINMNDDKEDGDIINERNNRRKPNFIDKIINKSLNRTTLFEINQQIGQGMRSQTFMNYITINIPLSDIVRKKMSGDILSYNHEMPTHPDDFPMHFTQFRNRMGFREQSDDQQFEPDPPVSQFLQRRLISMQSKSTSIYSFDRLYPDRQWDQGLLTSKISMSNIELVTLRSSYQAMKDVQNYRQKIGLALDRWDTQDLRPDINWTAIYNFDQKSSENFEVIYNHSRYLVFQNVGQTNLKIKRILIDTDEYQCASENGLLLVRNCRSLMKREFAPLENITLDLLVSPEFKDLNTFHFSNTFKLFKDLLYYGEINKKEKEAFEEQKRIILTLETEFFVQKFQIEIQYPSITGNIVEKIKKAQSTYLRENSFFSKILLICMIYSSGTYALQIIQTVIGWLFITNTGQEQQAVTSEVAKKEMKKQEVKNKSMVKEKGKKTQQLTIKDEQKVLVNSSVGLKKNERQFNEINQQNISINLDSNNKNQTILVDQINKFSKDSEKIYNKSEEVIFLQQEKVRKQIPFLKMQFTDQLVSLGYSHIKTFFNICKHAYIRNTLPDTGEIFFKTGLLIKENILPSRKDQNKVGLDKQFTSQISGSKRNIPQVFNEAMKAQNQLYPTSRLLEEFIDVQKRFDEDPQGFEATILSAHNTQHEINLFAPYYQVKKEEQALGQILNQTIMQIKQANQRKKQEITLNSPKKNPELPGNILLPKPVSASKTKQVEKKSEINEATAPILNKTKSNQLAEEYQSKNKQEIIANQAEKVLEPIIQEEKKQKIQQKPAAQQKAQKKPKKEKINLDQPVAQLITKPAAVREKTPEQRKIEKNEILTEEEKQVADIAHFESAEKTEQKKAMIKKVNKKDQKKIEARKKQEQQLAENARKLEQQMAEQALKMQQVTSIVNLKSPSPMKVKEQSPELVIFKSNSQKSITILSYHSSSDGQQPQNKKNKNKQKNSQNIQFIQDIQFNQEEVTNLNQETTIHDQPLIQDLSIIVKTEEDNQDKQFEKKTSSLKNPQSIIDEEFDVKLSFEKMDNSILNEPFDSSPKSEGDYNNRSPQQNLIYQAKRKVYEKKADLNNIIRNKSEEDFDKQPTDKRIIWGKSLQNEEFDNKKYESIQNTQTQKQEFQRTITTKQRVDPLPISKQLSSQQLFKEKQKYPESKYPEPKYPPRKYQETSIVWAENKPTYQQQEIRSKDDYRYDDEEEGITRGRDHQWRDYEELPYDSKDNRRRQLGRVEPQRTVDQYDLRRRQNYQYDDYEDEDNDRSLEKRSYGHHDDFYSNEVDRKNIQMYRQPYNTSGGYSYGPGRFTKNEETQNLVKQNTRGKPTGPSRQVYETNYEKEIKGAYPQYQPYTQRYAGVNPSLIRGKVPGFNSYYGRGGTANYNYRAKVDQQYYYENRNRDDYNEEEEDENFKSEQYHYSSKLTPLQQADSQRVKGAGFDASARGTNFRFYEPNNYYNQTQSLQNQRINQKTAIKREAAKNIRLRCQIQEQNESHRKGFGTAINESNFLQPIFKEDSIKRGRRQQSQSLTKNSNINQKMQKAPETQARISKYQIVSKQKPFTSNESESDSGSQFKNADSYYEDSNPSQSYIKTKKYEKVVEIIKSKKNSETKELDQQTTSQKAVSKKDVRVGREINLTESRVIKEQQVEQPEVVTEYPPYIRKEYKPMRQLQPDLNTKLFKFIRKYKPKESDQKETEVVPDVKIVEPVPIQEPEKKPQKSFYETYINVSSIFSDQFLSFGNSRQNNVKEDEEDDWIKPQGGEQIVENKNKAFDFSYAQFNNNQALPYSLFGDHQSRQREVSRFSRFLKGHEHEDEEAEEERHSIFNLGAQHSPK